MCAGGRCEDGALFHMDHTTRLASVGVSRFVILACGVNGQPPLLGTLRSLYAADVGTLGRGCFAPGSRYSGVQKLPVT